jgi:hypothetical protein
MEPPFGVRAGQIAIKTGTVPIWAFCAWAVGGSLVPDPGIRAADRMVAAGY